MVEYGEEVDGTDGTDSAIMAVLCSQGHRSLRYSKGRALVGLLHNMCLENNTSIYTSLFHLVVFLITFYAHECFLCHQTLRHK